MTTRADWHLRGVVTLLTDQHLRKMSTGDLVSRVLPTSKELGRDWKRRSNVSKSPIRVKNADKTTATILSKSSRSG